MESRIAQALGCGPNPDQGPWNGGGPQPAPDEAGHGPLLGTTFLGRISAKCSLLTASTLVLISALS